MKNDIFGYQIRSGISVILVMKSMLYKYIGCGLDIGTIVKNYFGVEICENGEKQRYRVSFGLNGCLLSKQ